MKTCIHSIFIVILLTVSISATSQNIANYEFEEWDSAHHYVPEMWYTPARNVKRSTDAKVGDYALRLENTANANGTFTGAYAYNRYLPNIKLLNGFPFTEDVLSIVFWAKYDLAEGDSAWLRCYMREGNITRGTVFFKMYGSTNGYFVKHSVPINWTSSRTPDTAWIYLNSSADAVVEGPGYIIFDDIHFENIGERATDMEYAGFEQWTDDGVHYPKDWRSLDLIYYDTYYSLRPNRSVFRSEDAFTGDYSLEVANYDNNGNIGTSYIYLGTKNEDYYTPTFKMQERYEYLQGYYKYLSPEPDSGRIIFRTYKDGANQSYDAHYFERANEWTYFSMPINYYNTKSPDSASIIIYSATGVIKSMESKFLIDHLGLLIEPSFGNVDQITQDIKVYPNPANQNITITLTHPAEIKFVNQLGEHVLIFAGQHGENTLNINTLSQGLYYILIKDDKEQWQTKIMKQ